MGGPHEQSGKTHETTPNLEAEHGAKSINGAAMEAAMHDKKAHAEDDIDEKFQDKQEEQLDKIQDLFDSHISNISLKEGPLNDAYGIRNRQMEAAKRLFDSASKEIAMNQSKDKLALTEFKKSVYENADSKAERLTNNIQRVFKLIGVLEESQNFTPEQILKLKQMTVGIEMISIEKDKENEDILAALSNGKLTDEMYEKIAAKLNPVSLNKINHSELSAEEAYEATDIGILVSLMSSEQIYILVDKMAEPESPKAKEAAQITDAFLTTGKLQARQGDELYSKMHENKLIDDQKYAEYKQKIDGNIYEKQATALKESFKKAVTNSEQTKFITNDFQEMFGNEAVGTLMSVHAGMWLITSILSSGGDFGEIATIHMYMLVWRNWV